VENKSHTVASIADSSPLYGAEGDVTCCKLNFNRCCARSNADTAQHSFVKSCQTPLLCYCINSSTYRF